MVDWDKLKIDLEKEKVLKKALEEEGWYGKKAREEFIRWVLKILRKRPNLWDLENKAIPELEKKGDKRTKPLKVVVEVIKKRKDFYGLKNEPVVSTGVQFETEEESIIEYEEFRGAIEGVIGRVALTQETPAEPYRFHFWLKPDPDVYLEPGELIEVTLGNGNYAIGLVEDLKTSSEKKNISEHYWSWLLGEAGVESPTNFPVMKYGSAMLVYRSDGRNIPFMHSHPIFKSKAETLEEAFSQLIKKEDDQILMGFVKDSMGRIVPVYGSFPHIFGYKSGHVNITGKSGFAGKTSYSLFLIASALAYSEKMEEEKRLDRTLGIIAFNVKERDLLDIANIPYENMEGALNDLEIKDPITAEMWGEAYRRGINPIELFKKARVYEPGKDFSFGLQDLISLGEPVILSLLNPNDVDDKMEALVNAICIEYGTKNWTFDEMIRNLVDRLAHGRSYITIGGNSIHVATLNKFLNRINKMLNQSSILERSRPTGKMLDIYELDLSDLWIINIEPLRDNEQRMVFYSILSLLYNILPIKKRSPEATVEGHSLASFPSRVAIFVDELNKFAPAGKGFSPIKNFIVEITARGRSMGLTLIGAQQFASQIDEEVLGNCSTFLIGKSEEFETSQKFYRRIPEGLRNRIGYLKQGELVFIHDPLQMPLVINFPKPLHRLGEE